jgi:aminoglycoside 6'-N-acetyltransferase
MDWVIAFRPLARDDFPQVASWLREPHVAEWWQEPHDSDGVEREFGPCVEGTDPTRVFVILSAERPVGVIQTYRLDDNPGYAVAIGIESGAGLDLFVGDPSMVGRGFGSSAIRLFLERVVWRVYPDVLHCAAGPSVRNLRSQRAFQRAGFVVRGPVHIPGEEDDELIMVATRPGRPVHRGVR